MRKYFILLLTLFLLIGCDFSTPKGKMFPASLPANQVRYPALVVSPDFVPSPLIEEEEKALDMIIRTQSRMGLDREDVRQIQLEGIRGINATFHNPNIAEELKFIGNIPGFIPGMNMFEYSDQVIQTMIAELKDYPISALKEYRKEVITWVYTLQRIKQSCTDPTVDECKLLGHVSDRYLLLREEIIKELSLKTKKEMGL